MRLRLAIALSIRLGVLAACLATWRASEGGDAKAVPGPYPGLMTIPAGSYQRGDHHGFVDPKHGSDEIPIRTLHIDAFAIGIYDVTNQEYCAFLNAASAMKATLVREGGVYLASGKELLCETRAMSPYSRIEFSGGKFRVLDDKADHPVVCVRWEGAVVYCNWLSAQKQLPKCYNLSTWECNFNTSGFRLPTEAEWEYAARGGQYQPYWNFPFANEADPTRANWPESKNPYRAGPQPWTTPVGFYDGRTHHKSEGHWPGDAESFQPGDGANGFGLYDMAGNVWQWCTEWYERHYYSYCPENNPPGPVSGSPMPDGKPYRCMRGGSWYNGEWGHSRVSNRDPSYFRGPKDPDHPYYHIGFRVLLPIDAEKRPPIALTPVERVRGGDEGPGGKPPRPGSRRKPRREGAGGNGEGRDDRPPPPRDDQGPGGADDRDRPPPPDDRRASADDRDRPPPPDDRGGGGQGGRRPHTEKVTAQNTRSYRRPDSTFTLTSPDVQEGAALPKVYTGDGDGISPPLSWSGAPADTRGYALIMHHLAPDGIKWYWLLYNLPPSVTSLPKDAHGVGTAGSNCVNPKLGYAPPHSKGPGLKKYTLTVYALSGRPKLDVDPAEVTRQTLLDAMQGLVLDSATLNVTYTREGSADRRGPEDRPRAKPPRE